MVVKVTVEALENEEPVGRDVYMVQNGKATHINRRGKIIKITDDYISTCGEAERIILRDVEALTGSLPEPDNLTQTCDKLLNEIVELRKKPRLSNSERVRLNKLEKEMEDYLV